VVFVSGSRSATLPLPATGAAVDELAAAVGAATAVDDVAAVVGATVDEAAGPLPHAANSEPSITAHASTALCLIGLKPSGMRFIMNLLVNA